MNGSNGLTAKPYEPSSSKQKKRFHDTWPRSTLLTCGEKLHKKMGTSPHDQANPLTRL